MKKKSAKRNSRVVSLLGRIFKIRTWLDIDRLHAFFIYMVESSAKVVTPPSKGRQNAFDKVVKEVGLSDTEMNKQAVALLWWSRLLCLVSLGVFGVGMYHGYEGHIRACLLSILVMMVGMTLAFRYHFLYFQIRERRLGCTVQEWFKYGLLGRGSRP